MRQPHLRCTAREINKYCILPGDPSRAERIAKQLTNVKHIGFNREFNIFSGNYKGIPITVCSTGIGGPSTAIAVHELVNCGAKILIRVGSCGALQKKIKLGETIIPTGAIRSESTSQLYYPREHPALAHPLILKALKSSAREAHVGTINSHDGFYHKDSQSMDDFWSNNGILGSDFETAPLFIVAEYLKVMAGSILNVVARHGANDSISVASYAAGEKSLMKGEEKSIKIVLSAIKKIGEFYGKKN